MSSEDAIRSMKCMIAPILSVINAISSANPVSTTSERDRHQLTFKESLKDRYECRNLVNKNVTKCMVLNHFFSSDTVKASDIIGLYEKKLCKVFGIDSVWNPRNGILLHNSLGKHFERMEIVSLTTYIDV